MLPLHIQFGLCWALSLSFAFAKSVPVDYKIRNAAGLSNRGTIQAIGRELQTAKYLRRDGEWKGSTLLDKSWDGAVLLKLGLEKTFGETNKTQATGSAGVEIVCTTCYIKGSATAELNIKGDINASQIINQTIHQVQGKVENFTDMVDDYFVNYTKGVATKFRDGIQKSDFDFPTFPFDFGLDISTIPDANLRFQFNGLELYMKLNTVLSLGATYTINLFSSQTPVGIRISKNLELGVVFAIDLILDVQGKVDISSGLHIKLEDGVSINIAMFSNNISNIVFNGGQFEFLPVTVESAGIVFSAILQIGIHAGFELATPNIPEFTAANTTFSIPSVKGGVEVGVFANVAEFITNVTVAPKDAKCNLEVVQSYQMALGAAAGATVAIADQVWGPVAATSVPIWYTEAGALCAIKPSATPSSTLIARAAMAREGDMTTTTTKTKITYTGVACSSQGLANCPASLQITTKTIETKTLTATVKSGQTYAWPATTANTVSSTIAFGKSAMHLVKTSGVPTSYIPPAPSPTSTHLGASGTSLDGKVKGMNKKVIIGVSIGIGIPVLLALAAGIFFMQKRRKYTAVPKRENVPMEAEPYHHGHDHYTDKPSKAGVKVTEVET